jgi:hypothetical protein
MNSKKALLIGFLVIILIVVSMVYAEPNNDNESPRSVGSAVGVKCPWTLCGTTCINLKNNNLNCGTCGNACEIGKEECKNSACVAVSKPKKKCRSPLDCSDNDVCTNDLCMPDGTCQNPSIPNCCILDAECIDPWPCTDDVCIDHRCTNHEKNCADTDACTVDTCDPVTGACLHSPPMSCDDTDACTNDYCVDGKCFHSPRCPSEMYCDPATGECLCNPPCYPFGGGCDCP